MSIREIRVLPRGNELWVLGMGTEGEACLKARLPSTAEHPRAAIELLESLALWSGRRLPVVLGVNARSGRCIEALLPAGPAWCSPLVELIPVPWPRRPTRRRLNGLGDFRVLHQLKLPGFDG